MDTSIDYLSALRERLKAMHGRLRELERTSGLSYSWLCKFGQGRQANPTYESVRALTAALDQMEFGSISADRQPDTNDPHPAPPAAPPNSEVSHAA